MVVLVHNRLLVVAVALVASLEFGQMIHIPVAVLIPLDDNLIGSGTFYHACIPGNHTHTGVNRCL